MKTLFLFVLLIPSLLFAQTINERLENLDSKDQIDSLITLPYQIIINDFSSTEKWINKLSPIAKEQNRINDYAELIRIKSTISYYQGKYDNSTKEALQSIHLFDSLNNLKKVASIYAELGYQIKRVNIIEAQKYMLKGIKLSEKFDDSATLSSSYNNYGVIKELKNQLDSALIYYTKSLQINTDIVNPLGTSYALNNIAGIYILKDNYQEAISNVKNALKIRQTLNDNIGIMESENILGDVFIHFNQLDSAINHYSISLNQSRNSDYLYLQQQNLEGLSKCYKQNNDFEKALFYKNQFILINDSIRTSDTNKEIASLKEKFDSDKKDQEIAYKDEVIETDSKLRLLLFSLIGIIVVLFISFYFWYKSKQKQKLQSELLKEKERGLANIIDAQEEERKRIARELHDGIVQELTSLKFNLKNEFEKNPSEDSSKIFNQLENSTTELRNISHQMMPHALTELGVIDAVKDMLHKSLDPLSIKFEFETFGIKDRLKENIEITIYRVSQELVNNIIKHSGANQVSVQLFKSSGNVILIVEDNGRGISNTDKKEGIGLMNISSRLDTINGKVNFEASPNSGTLATIKIPLND